MCDAGCAMKEFGRFTSFVSGANGRDKFSKSIQYGSKLLFYILAQSASQTNDNNKLALSKQMKSLSGGVSTSRKCNRLFKFLVEYEKMMKLIVEPNNDATLVGLKLCYSFAFALYWYYDNKVFLAKIGYWKDLDIKSNVTKGSRWWFLGLMFGFAIVLRELSKLNEQKRKLSKSESFGATQNNINKTNNNIFLKKLQFIAMCGDITVAANNSGLAQKLLGHTFNDGILGSAGLMSALLTCYRLYK